MWSASRGSQESSTTKEVPIDKLKSVASLLQLVRGTNSLEVDSIGTIIDVVAKEVNSLIKQKKEHMHARH